MLFYKYKLIILHLLILSFGIANLSARDLILEFKAAALVPTNHTFRSAYRNSIALFGPELTVQLNRDWYGFIAANYFQRNGRYLGTSEDTKLRAMPLAIGLKCFLPVNHGTSLYLGLGFQPIYLHTKNSRGLVTATESFWGFGGIAKSGIFIDLGNNFLLDLFADYNFVKIGVSDFYGHTMTPIKTNISSVILGAGLGYRF